MLFGYVISVPSVFSYPFSPFPSIEHSVKIVPSIHAGFENKLVEGTKENPGADFYHDHIAKVSGFSRLGQTWPYDKQTQLVCFEEARRKNL